MRLHSLASVKSYRLAKCTWLEKNISDTVKDPGTTRVSSEMKKLIEERKEIDARKTDVKKRIKDARQQVYQFRWTLMDQKREVARIRKWIRNNPGFVEDEVKNQDFRNRLDDVAKVIEGLLERQDGFEKEMVRDEVVDVVMLALKLKKKNSMLVIKKPLSANET